MNTLESVQKLLEENKISEAQTIVQKALKTDPENLDAKRASAHVFYHQMVAAYDAKNLDEAIVQYGNYYSLQLPEDDELHETFKPFQRKIHPEFPRMQEANKLSKSGKNLEALAIYEEVLSTIKDYKVAYVNVGWCIYRLLAELAPKKDPDVDLINKCFNLYNKFEILGASNLHAQMLRIALYFKDIEGVNLADFLHTWNFDNFRDEDYNPFKTDGGVFIPSLCERAYLTYSRVLMNDLGSADAKKVENAKKYSAEFLPLLEETFERLPRNSWLPYARTLLMIKLGKVQRAQMELLHLLKSQNNIFWAWAALAECMTTEGKDQDAIACYCKSFLLPSQGELSTAVRTTFIKLLVKQEMYAEAKSEIENVTRSQVKKKPSKDNIDIADLYKSEEWFENTRASNNPKLLYTRFAGRADGLLWLDVPEQVAVVTHVDLERGLFFFAVDKRIGGKHNLKGALAKVKVGTILALRLKEEEKMGQKAFKVVGSRIEREKFPKDICQMLDEPVQIPYGRDFGFLKPSNIYVGPDIVKRYKLYDGQRVKALSLLSYNKAKSEWGWKVISMSTQED